MQQLHFRRAMPTPLLLCMPHLPFWLLHACIRCMPRCATLLACYVAAGTSLKACRLLLPHHVQRSPLGPIC